MKVNIKKLFITMILIFPTITGFALSPVGQYNSGRRAFMLGHWQEAKETFEKFLKTWPDHPLSTKAIYFKTVSGIKYTAIENKENQLLELASLTQVLRLTEEKLPNFDTSELKIEIKAKNNSPWNIQTLKGLSQNELKHVIDRNWYPDPSNFPIRTLEWVYQWRKLHNKGLRPDIEASINYIKALALWQVAKSPLAKEANISILKLLGNWPVHSALEEALDTGFSKGNSSMKRNIALLGYHYEYFSHNTVTRYKQRAKQSRWYKYLNGRGLNHSEAWCPR